MAADIAEGLVPCFVVAVLGTTGTAAFDRLDEIAEVCENQAPRVWLHVDAAYGGGALFCPELRPLAAGLHRADSLNTNPNKWMNTVADCSLLWVREII